jgi:hypothetical protein
MTLRKRDHLRLYESIDVVRYKYQGPTDSPRRYAKLKADILENGVRHPVILAWADAAQDWRPVIGNNRIAVLAEIGQRHACALVLGPEHQVSWPVGEHEVMPLDANLLARLTTLWSGFDTRSTRAYPWQALVELKDVR